MGTPQAEAAVINEQRLKELLALPREVLFSMMRVIQPVYDLSVFDIDDDDLFREAYNTTANYRAAHPCGQREAAGRLIALVVEYDHEHP